MEGNPTPADLAQFREVIAMLEDKKTKLLTQIDEIQQDISAISAKTKTEKQKSLQVDRQLAEAEAEAKKRPSKEERKQAEHLQHQITDLKSQIDSVYEQITAKRTEKENLMKSLHNPAPTSRRSSVKFIHQLLLNELSSLVAHHATPDVLQRKEQQIRLCEALMTM